ncbi:MAG: serine/threonine transporter SstT [Kiritimatiellae bacterium]|nr:serine/threonine transporter SstT [Kiritimatiellia bacterium]
MSSEPPFARLLRAYLGVNLVLRIACGLAVGVALALVAPAWSAVGILGDLFVGALKAIAPVLVALLVTSSIASGRTKPDRRFGRVILLYLGGTFLAALVAVAGSFMFPQTLDLPAAAAAAAPCQLSDVIRNLMASIAVNPVEAVATANYLGVLFWSVLFGIALRRTTDGQVRAGLAVAAEVTSAVVRGIINCAPFGIMGLVFTAVSQNGPSVFRTYGSLVALLVSCMAIVALVTNPLLVFLATRRNPYPLVFTCLRRSGVTAFFTRSSAANIPVNMALCEDLGLDEDFYSVSVPLGATINMSGAAVTITIMALAAAHTLGVRPDAVSAMMLSVLATFAACGASGVAGGSLLLIPLACSLFGISNEAAMQVVGVGFVIGVVQDSFETMLNSSGDVLFAAAAEYRPTKRA